MRTRAVDEAKALRATLRAARRMLDSGVPLAEIERLHGHEIADHIDRAQERDHDWQYRQRSTLADPSDNAAARRRRRRDAERAA